MVGVEVFSLILLPRVVSLFPFLVGVFGVHKIQQSNTNKFDLRLATKDDVEELAMLGQEVFTLECPYTETHTYSGDRVKELVLSLLKLGEDSAIILLGVVQGKIVGILAALKTFTTVGLEPTVMELLWWVDSRAKQPRLAIQMIKAFEYWADKVGVTRLVLSSMENKHSASTEKYYKHLGYTLTEKTYVKRIK